MSSPLSPHEGQVSLDTDRPANCLWVLGVNSLVKHCGLCQTLGSVRIYSGPFTGLTWGWVSAGSKQGVVLDLCEPKQWLVAITHDQSWTVFIYLFIYLSSHLHSQLFNMLFILLKCS